MSADGGRAFTPKPLHNEINTTRHISGTITQEATNTSTPPKSFVGTSVADIFSMQYCIVTRHVTTSNDSCGSCFHCPEIN